MLKSKRSVDNVLALQFKVNKLFSRKQTLNSQAPLFSRMNKLFSFLWGQTLLMPGRKLCNRWKVGAG